MLTDKELKFIKDWEINREEYSRFGSKMRRGLPMAMVFSFPIFFSVASVYFFSPEWFTKISQNAISSFVAILLAVLLTILFFSFFRMHFKWEMNDQLYKELKIKMKKDLKDIN
jgi:hypothetical protein